MNIIKILDIEFDLSLINISKVAKKAGIRQKYASELLDKKNRKKKQRSLAKPRSAIIELYGNLVKYNKNKKVRAAA